MKSITFAAAVLTAVVVAVAPAQAARAASIAPHVYSTKISGATPAVLNGTWRLTVRSTGFSVTKGSALAVLGSVRIAGKRITFHDLGGPFACRGARATGVYTWRIAGTRLTLTAVREPCSGRKTILTKPFTRVL
jgi:hypothetical protein